MDMINDRRDKDLTEAEEIKKLQEYTKRLWKRSLNDPVNHHGVFTHPDLNNLECEVKWSLGIITMNKASGGDRILPGNYFKS